MKPSAERITAGANAMNAISDFLSQRQKLAVRDLMHGEEGDFFIDKMIELAARIAAMPHTYQQDGLGDKAIAYLHYFVGNFDCWITEKDMEAEQLQAFGLAKFAGSDAELGYISLVEVLANHAELDFHFTPKTIREIKSEL